MKKMTLLAILVLTIIIPGFTAAASDVDVNVGVDNVASVSSSQCGCIDETQCQDIPACNNSRRSDIAAMRSYNNRMGNSVSYSDDIVTGDYGPNISLEPSRRLPMTTMPMSIINVTGGYGAHTIESR